MRLVPTLAFLLLLGVVFPSVCLVGHFWSRIVGLETEREWFAVDFVKGSNRLWNTTRPSTNETEYLTLVSPDKMSTWFIPTVFSMSIFFASQLTGLVRDFWMAVVFVVVSSFLAGILIGSCIERPQHKEASE